MRMRVASMGVGVGIAALVVPFLPATIAGATAFPGANGKIVYSSYKISEAGSFEQIFVITRNGRTKTRLTNTNSSNVSPEWSADGEKIIFVRQPVHGDSDLMVMNADGTGVVNLTDTNSKDEYAPTWSPDGGSVAFVMYRESTGFSDIYILDLTTDVVTRWTDNGSNNYDPAWSPDGASIAWSVVDAEGYVTTGVEDIAHTTSFSIPKGETESDSSPNFSPDGSMIVFTRWSVDMVDSEIFISDFSEEVTQLTNNSANEGYPAFSPNGSKIVLTKGVRGEQRPLLDRHRRHQPLASDQR